MELRTEYADTQLALVERGRGIKTADAPLSKYQRLVKTFRQHWFLVLVLLPYNAIHPVPGLSFSINIEQMGQKTSYRVEALIAGIQMSPMPPAKNPHSKQESYLTYAPMRPT